MQALSGLNTGTNSWTPVAIQDFKEAVTYDPNGNIRTYTRNGNNTFAGKPLAMDNLAYGYAAASNKLSNITDAVPATNYDNDIDSQASSNYFYDAAGRMTADQAAGIRINWNYRSKISRIATISNVLIANFTYDVSTNRISKIARGIETWYVRDAAGNVMSTYTKGDSNVNNGELTQTEVHLYGSSRLGINTLNTNVQNALQPEVVSLPGLGSGININFIRGKKFFELSNHLGNVLATVSDKKLGISENGSTVDHYEADVVSAQEYYPFGMQMPGRGFSSSKYRYGFNGKENDGEIKGEGNQQDYGFRIYDPRVGRFLSIDPLTKEYPELTPYQFSGNTPIQATDLDGAETYIQRQGNATRRYAEIKVAQAEQIRIQSERLKYPEPHILLSDLYGNGHMGPESIVRRNVAMIKEDYDDALGATIASGPFASAGYLLGGDRSAFKWSVADGVMTSFGGIPAENSGVFPKARGQEPVGSSANTEFVAFPRYEGVSIARIEFGTELPGRVQSRINITNKGWAHVVDRHFYGTRKASQFIVSESVLRQILATKEVVQSPIIRTLKSEDGTRYVRQIELNAPIGIDKFNNWKPTSTMTVMTDEIGNLISATPGIVK
jgi:RHS repeat-associated protein